MEKNENTLVSVIMPAYNCVDYISQAVQSVLHQSHNCLELIVVDDCSKDGTYQIVQQFAQADSRIRLYRNERNMGVSATRNRAILLAKGDWIAFLDSDDYWEPTKLERQVYHAKDTNALLQYTGVSYIRHNHLIGAYHVPPMITYRELLKQNVIACSSVFLHRSLIQDLKMENDETHEDFGLWLRILKNIDCAHGICEPLMVYRYTEHSKTGNQLKSMMMTYRTYRYIGLDALRSGYYLVYSFAKNIQKFFHLKKTVRHTRVDLP